jgi:hypothetical protein
MPQNDLNKEASSVVTLPAGYRQGVVTAITVFLGFSLSFIRFWNFEGDARWSWVEAIPAIIVAAGTAVQLVALYRALQVEDDRPDHYALTVRSFFYGIAIVVVGVVVATIIA